MKFVLKLLTLLVLIMQLSACASTPEELETLDKTLESYERLMRWGSYTAAVAFQEKPKDLQDWERHQLKNIRVTSYRMISQDVAPDYSAATIIVDIRYYFASSQIERVYTDRQQWKYIKESEKWYLTSQFPKFKFR